MFRAYREIKKTVGTAILGFAVMMIGMNLMSQGVSPLKEVPALQNMLVSFSAPVLGFLFAAAFTMLLQSSDATIGILQAFALSMGVTYGMAVPLVCGAQAGTCITAILASLGGSNNARRTALLNLFYNLFKVIPFMLIFYLLNGALHFSFLESGVGSIGIPLFHSLLNLAAAAVWLPLADVIVKLAKRAVPYSAEEKEEQANVLTMLDPILLSNPGFALDQADKAVLALGEAAGEAFTVLSHLKKGPEIAEKVRILCKRTDTFREQIDRYLAEISMKHLQEKEAARLSLLLCANAAFGKIGTITGRVMDKSREYSGSEDLFSEAEQMEANMFASAINEIVAFTITGFESKNPALSNMIQIYREAITEMNAMVTIRHIRRVHQKEGKTVYSTIFTDICYAEERLIDCCDSIADALIEYAGATGNESGIPQAADAEKRKRIKQLFLDKYDILHLDMQEETGSPL